MNLQGPWLFIDSAVSGNSRVGILGASRASVRSVKGRTSVLLPAIAKLGAALEGIRGVVVVRGPGSFSAIRGGVLIANLIARLRRVPLIGVSPSDAEDLPRLVQGLASNAFSPERMIEPVYDAEPNITLARSSQ